MGEGEPKYLNLPETSLFEKGRELYGLTQARDAIRTAGRVLVVEGYMDVVALAQFGVGYAVATLGTATTPVHVAKLLRLADEIVFCFDGDKAGRKAAWRALEVSLPLAVDHKPMRFLFLPAEDDPDSYVRMHGQEAFEKLAREAQTLSGFLLGELRSGADLSTPEGRSKFLTEAKPHLQKITAPGLRLQLLKEIAGLGGIAQNEAEELLELRSPASRTYARPAPTRRAVTPAVNSDEQRLLRCVLAQPSLVGRIEFDLLDESKAEVAILRRIAELLEETDPSSAMLMDHFQDSGYGELLAQTLSSVEVHGPKAEAAGGELGHTILNLRIRRKNEECSDLGARADADKALRPAYQASLKELNLLKETQRRQEV